MDETRDKILQGRLERQDYDLNEVYQFLQVLKQLIEIQTCIFDPIILEE